jgi:hypothetical protein
LSYRHTTQPTSIVILERSEGSASVVVVACSPASATNDRVPHPSQLHRDGWECKTSNRQLSLCMITIRRVQTITAGHNPEGPDFSRAVKNHAQSALPLCRRPSLPLPVFLLPVLPHLTLAPTESAVPHALSETSVSPATYQLPCHPASGHRTSHP